MQFNVAVMVLTGLIILAAVTNLFKTCEGFEQEVLVQESTDSIALSKQICAYSTFSCTNFVRPVIELQKHEKYGHDLLGWRFNDACKIFLPPQVKLPVLQYFHIPKSGTSINWFLRDYFDGCGVISKEEDPCPVWLKNEREQVDGLCNGRLFSCMGHAVHPDLPNIVLNNHTNVVTILREPFSRLQSDYYYILNNPSTGHLGAEFNISLLLEHVGQASSLGGKLLRFATYPGIANCATKMLNGFDCGSDKKLNETHFHIAIRTLDSFLFYGITELFPQSICLFAFIYGGEPSTHHFRQFRKGNYQSLRMEEAFSKIEQEEFTQSEQYDIKLYKYAYENFMKFIELSKCGGNAKGPEI